MILVVGDNWNKRSVWHEGDDAVLHLEDVRVYPQKGGQVGGRLEEAARGRLPELADRQVEELFNVNLAVDLDLLPEELDELVGEDRVDLDLLHLGEGVGDLALVLLQVDNLLFDDKLLRVLGQKVSELLDVLAGDVPDLGRGLGPVAEQALDRHLCTSSVLPTIKASFFYKETKSEFKKIWAQAQLDEC